MLTRRMPTKPSPTAELCALQTAIAGTVIRPEAPEFETLRAPALARPDDVRPLAIVACRTAEDVSHSLAVARRLGIRIAPRSGGHCFAGRSSTTGILLDVSPMDSVAVDEDVAVVGAGVRLGALYDALHLRGRAVPAGCGATVGIAGLTLGGGIGVLGRSHGLTCDRLVAAEVVLADGRIVHCDADHYPDLLWGLRGAGGGQFGVVTSLSLQTVPAPTTTTFRLQWGALHAADSIAAWQGWAPEAPDAVDATLRVTAPGDPAQPPTVQLVGAIHEHRAEAAALLDGLILRVGAEPDAATMHQALYRDGKAWLTERGDAPEDAAVAITASELFHRDLPSDVVASLLADLPAHRGGHSRQLTFTPLGGAYNRVPIDATAFAHRRERFMLEHSTSALPADLPLARTWARCSRAIAHRVGSGRVYPNFPDPELSHSAWAYHGENLVRLRRVKRRYDPDRVFSFNQSL